MKGLCPRACLVLVAALCGVMAVGCAGRRASWPEMTTRAWTSPAAPEAEASKDETAAPVPEEVPTASARAYTSGEQWSESPGETAPEEFSGVYHEVRAGETLWRIARTYEVDLETLQWVNDVEDVTDVRVGRILFIPGARQLLAVPPLLPEELVPVPEGKVSISWPLKGRLTSRFGPRGHRKHEGIDLAAPTGTPVRAAAEGKVAYSGAGMGGYGKVVVLKHADDFSTVYAHNSALLVKMGERVLKGQVIARVGSTGKSTGPHLHFEVRNRGVAKNPLDYLPAP